MRTPGDCSILQADLQHVYNWAEHVNMEFNADKFECLQFWPSPDSDLSCRYTAPDNSVIEVKDSLRDLSVQLSTDMTFTVHVENIVVAAARLAGWGLRTFWRRSRSTMLTIFKTLIQPKFDYCSQLYSPTKQDLINKIESVQRNFTSNIIGLKDLDYWTRLSELRLFSQERRRERYIIIFLWKISQRKVEGYDIEFMTSDRRGRYVVPKPVIRSASASVRRAREGSLGVRGAILFNLLPAHIRDSNVTSVEAFKVLLDTYLRTIPDQPTDTMKLMETS